MKKKLDNKNKILRKKRVNKTEVGFVLMMEFVNSRYNQ
jgi:hypothetical protein